MLSIDLYFNGAGDIPFPLKIKTSRLLGSRFLENSHKRSSLKTVHRTVFLTVGFKSCHRQNIKVVIYFKPMLSIDLYFNVLGRHTDSGSTLSSRRESY